MAKPHYLFSLFICLVVLFHGSLARQQLQQQNECQLRNLEALEPDNRIDSEAGSTESWNPNNEQFICAGVAVVRRIIEPKGLLLPQYSNAPQLVYIERGRGMTGALFPGCAETFQESQQQGGSSRVQDRHQKIRRFRQGDILALPAGVAHWCYNDGNEPVVAVYVLDTSNSNNQLDMSPRHFYLAGNVEEEFRQQFESGREGSRPEPYSTSRRKRQQGSCNNLFCGIDSRLLAEAFNIDLSLARKLQSESDFRGSIVRVEGVELDIVRPARTEQERIEQVEPCRDGGRCPVGGAGGQCNGGAGGHCNGIEETFCTMRMRENIADPSRADVFVPEVGRLSTVNSHNLPILRWLRLSASYVVLRNDAVRLPHWYLNAHSIMYAVRGQGRVQVVDEYGYSVFDGNFREGQVLVVPQNFVVVKRSDCDLFEYVAFNTNDNAMTNDLAGRTSALRAMPVEVIANAFQVSVEDARSIKFSREETTFALSRSRSVPIAEA